MDFVDIWGREALWEAKPLSVFKLLFEIEFLKVDVKELT